MRRKGGNNASEYLEDRLSRPRNNNCKGFRVE
jgi:hypothetical protein